MLLLKRILTAVACFVPLAVVLFFCIALIGGMIVGGIAGAHTGNAKDGAEAGRVSGEHFGATYGGLILAVATVLGVAISGVLTFGGIFPWCRRTVANRDAVLESLAGKMNPYEPPQTVTAREAVGLSPVSGRPCASCGSMNTHRDMLSRQSPNVLYVILFGWVFLLIRGAFAKRTEYCGDCGAVSRYRSLGSRVAMGALIVLVALVAAAVFGAGNSG